MRAPGAAEMLDLWDRSSGKTPIEKSMELLSLASPEGDPAGLSIGRRDACLFRLRERFFGPLFSNIADCPSCGERVEWSGNIRDLLVDGEEKEGVFTLYAASYVILFRLPNSYDLMNAAAYRDHSEWLLRDCILEARKQDAYCDVADLPEDVFDLLDRRMAEEDPQADISMLLSCAKCAHQWEMPFDIGSYLWMEIDSWAKRVLREVAMLAAAFGWSESDILQMSPRRRRLYLEMIKQ
ncbi:MAG: hypothetical protein J0H74_30205 [Chitinophagaceae bacterium]|nr:hypothetical protein [Chitinophagaceae bacterium]